MTVSFILVFIVGGVTFGYTWQGQTAFMQRTESTAHATYDATAIEPDEPVVVRIRIDNPTSKPVTIVSGSLFGKLNGETVVRDDTGAVSTRRIPAGGSRTLTVECHFTDRSSNSTTVTRVRNGEMKVVGLLTAEMVDKKFEIQVTPDE